MTDVYRTPEERFADLPGFPWEPRYSDWEGLRIARIDESPPQGEQAAPVVLFPGEPTWSYLYRKMIPPLLEAGHRCIAPDYPGFGRSDKPTDLDWYTFDRHTEASDAVVASWTSSPSAYTNAGTASTAPPPPTRPSMNPIASP